MKKTLLELIRSVAGELALPTPTEVLSTEDATTKQLLALTIAACDELLDSHDWQQLIVRYSFTTSGSTDEYPLPYDYHRLVPNTVWDRTNTRQLSGGQTPLQWNSLNATSPSPLTRFRLLNNRLKLFPVPGSTPITITLDYVTRNYVYDVGNNIQKPEFALDSDITIFHDRLLINFVKLKFLQEQGMNTVAATENYNTSLAAAKSADAPPSIISMAPHYGLHLIDGSNLPISNWGA